MAVSETHPGGGFQDAQAEIVESFATVDPRLQKTLIKVKEKAIPALGAHPSLSLAIEVAGEVIGTDVEFDRKIAAHIRSEDVLGNNTGEEGVAKSPKRILTESQVYAVATLLHVIKARKLPPEKPINWIGNEGERSIEGEAIFLLGDDPVKNEIRDPYPLAPEEEAALPQRKRRRSTPTPPAVELVDRSVLQIPPDDTSGEANSINGADVQVSSPTGAEVNDAAGFAAPAEVGAPFHNGEGAIVETGDKQHGGVIYGDFAAGAAARIDDAYTAYRESIVDPQTTGDDLPTHHSEVDGDIDSVTVVVADAPIDEEADPKRAEYMRLIEGTTPDMHALLEKKILPLLLAKDNPDTSLRGAVREAVVALGMDRSMVDQIYMYIYQAGGIKTIKGVQDGKQLTMVDAAGFLVVSAFVETIRHYDASHPNTKREGMGENGLYRTTLRALGESSLVTDRAFYYPYSEKQEARWAARNATQLARQQSLGESASASSVAQSGVDTPSLPSAPVTLSRAPLSASRGNERMVFQQAQPRDKHAASAPQDESPAAQAGFIDVSHRTDGASIGDEVEIINGEFSVSEEIQDDPPKRTRQTRKQVNEIPLEQLMITVERRRQVQAAVPTHVIFDSGNAVPKLSDTVGERLKPGFETSEEIDAFREEMRLAAERRSEVARRKKAAEKEGVAYVPEIPGYVDDAKQTVEALKKGDVLRDSDDMIGKCERLAEVEGKLYITVSVPGSTEKRSVLASKLGDRYFRLKKRE